jgi:large subunit ribosomal protein L32e
MKGKKKKPKFNVPNLGFFRSVKPRWRKPRGTHNKKRMKFKFMGASPRVGYRNPQETRHLHPAGAREVLINSLAELASLKEKGVVLRLGSSVGARKRKLMAEKAKSMNLKIINYAENGKGEWQRSRPPAKK